MTLSSAVRRLPLLVLPALFLVALLVAAPLVVAPLAAQDKPATKPKKARSYYPLAVDATWKYRDTGGAEGRAVECEYRCLGPVELENGTCHELLYRRGKYTNYEYWASRKQGLFTHHRAYLGGWRGVNRRRKGRMMLACPVGATLSWKWTEMGSVQTMGGAAQPDPETLKIHYTARIEEIQDKVEVPAGKFTAVRVRITTKGFYKSDTTWWFAEGVGPVKRVEKGSRNKPDRVLELIKFTPGIEVKETTKATALRFLNENEEWKKLGKPSRFGQINQKTLRTWFVNQFFIARWQGRKEPLFLRVRRGVAHRFDPADILHWRQLLVDEGVKLSRNPLGHGHADQAALHFTQALAIFVGELQGPAFRPYLRSSDFVTTVAFRENTITVKGKIRGGGKTTSNIRIPVRMVFDDKTLTKIEGQGLGQQQGDQRKVGR